MNHYAKPVLTVGYKIIGQYFSWMRKYSKHPEKYPMDIRYKKVRKLLNDLSKSFNVEYHVEGLENIPEETCCFISNHLSAFDPLSLICVMDKPCTFVAKKELKGKPFVSKIIEGMGGLFIDRQDLKQSLKVMMKVEEDLKHQKEKNWIIYPEGTRNKDVMANLRMFHHGTFRPAVKAGVPIVPVATFGTFRVLKGKPNFKKYPVFIKFLKPIYPEDYKDMNTMDIANNVASRIEREVDFDLRRRDHLEMKKIGNKNYRFNQIL